MPDLVAQSLITGRTYRLTLGRGLAGLSEVSDPDQGAEERIVPGLFDLQVNGAGRHDLSSPDITTADVAELAMLEWKLGTTRFCPTIVTGPKERTLNSLEVVSRAREEDALLAYAMPFIHMEGPHISVLDGPRGAHDSAYIRPPDLREFEEWQRAAKGAIGIVTLAPELPGALEYIEGLGRAGVVAAIGHTAATPNEIGLAVSAGARCSTHLGNGCEDVLPRHPNRIWTQLADKRLYATFIGDGHHLDDDTLAAMIAAKGIRRSILVSDSVATPGSGLDRGAWSQRLELPGTPYLAGSAMALMPSVIALVGRRRLNWVRAARVASINPWRLLARESVGGRFSFGPADVSIVKFEKGRPAVGGVVVDGVLIRA
ncbi:MAG: N-acetylglucosamine-6-phosphate deacetylase [Acidimicrobiales bacterium]